MDRSTNQGVPSPAKAEREMGSTLITGSLVLGGLVAVVGGLFLAVGPPYSSEVSWIARRFGEMGISSGAVIGSGVLCAVMGFVANRIARVGQQMRSAEEAMKCTQDLSLANRHMVARITRMHAEVNEVKEGISGLIRIAKEQTSAKVAGMQVDATYRLAASMDQMGMRIEDRMQAQESTIESRLMELFGSLSSSHEQLQTLLNHRPDSFDEDMLDTAPLRHEPVFDAEARLPHEDELDDNELQLEVFVDLEDELEEDFDDGEPQEGPIDVSQFDWDSIEVEPTMEGLGLLDELDDEGIPRNSASNGDLDQAPSLLPGKDPSEEFSEEALEKAWRDFKRRRDG